MSKKPGKTKMGAASETIDARRSGRRASPLGKAGLLTSSAGQYRLARESPVGTRRETAPGLFGKMSVNAESENEP
jgi:hypothetical protein